MSSSTPISPSSQNPPRREFPGDSSPTGGLPLKPSEVAAFRLKTFATLPTLFQEAPPQSVIDQPTEFATVDKMTAFIEAVDDLCDEDALNEKLCAAACKREERPWFHKANDDISLFHVFYVYEYLFTGLGNRFPFSPFFCTFCRTSSAKSLKAKGWISLKARTGRKCLNPLKSNA